MNRADPDPIRISVAPQGPANSDNQDPLVLVVTHEDGTEVDAKPGDVYRIAPGHDSWVVGDEPAVFVEFQGAASFAKS